jgi:MFS transporter, Spinster family, sphingosine-1-phosphate transporter
VSGPAPAAPPPPGPLRPPAPGATFALVVLTAMNLLNYVDRWVPSAVKELIKGDLKLSDAQTSWPLSAFIVVYMLASPVFGSLAGRYNRRFLVAAGVAAWSLATAAAALAQGFTSLLVARAAVGIGEAAYATLAPAILADFYPPERRNRVFTLFYVATPVGSAIGFVLGGFLGEHLGWRASFLAVGLPGVLAAGLALLMKDPVRGAFDDAAPVEVSWPQALRALRANRLFVLTVAGYCAVSFATGGIADWFPTFLFRLRGMPLASADLAIGLAAVVGGIVGTAWGGAAADRLAGRTRQPYLALSGLSMVPAAVLSAVALFALREPPLIVAAVVATQLFLWAYNAPVNALIVNSVGPQLRARAVGISILSIHLLGDVLSPPLIGLLSDATGNLEAALLMVPVALAVGAGLWLYGWRALPSPVEPDYNPTA